MPRFTCVAEPYGNWMVWDETKKGPATLGGKPLVGLPKHRADTARNILERIEAADTKSNRE
jgi:hypothetical protein